jgi:D-alanyl-D-alanine endopeptidase (penicillin-binding protein 7)
LSFGLSVSLPTTVEAAAQSRRTTVRKSTAKKTSTATRAKRSRAARSKVSAVRRARLARARAVARAAAIREATLPRYKTDATGALVPDLHAAAAIIYNPETKQVLWEEHSQDKRSIASITKVMTAVVFSETDPDPAQMVTVERSDVYAASTTHLRAKYVVSVDDLMHLLLISSDNAAARALARVSPWGSDGFIRRMNEKAVELGLQSTTYADPSGLDASNVSSAYDMARLITYAAGDEWISDIMRKKEHQLVLGRRSRTIHSTNRLLANSQLQPNVLGGKTGFINRAGYCFATVLKLPGVNQPVAVVVLGARSNAARFTEARNLFGWISDKAKDLVGAKDEKPE